LQIIIKINNLIIKIRLSEAQITNEYFLKEDEKILKFIFDSENNKKLNIKEVIAFDKKKDYKLVKILEDALLISLFSEVDIEIIFYIQLSVRLND